MNEHRGLDARDLLLERVVASNADHVVWRARDRDGRLRAVKALRPGAPLRGRVALAREAWVGRACSHEALAQPGRLGLRAGLLVGPWLPGGSLADLLASVGPVGPRSACVLGERIGAGLSALHARGWAHGDLHLANVVLDGDGAPVLVDLGRAVPLRRRPAAAEADIAAMARIVRRLAVGMELGDVPEALDAALRLPSSAAALTHALLELRGTLEATAPRPGPVELEPEATTADSTSPVGSSTGRGRGQRRIATGRSEAVRSWPTRRWAAVGFGAVTLVLLGALSLQLRPGPGAEACPRPEGPAVDIDADGCAETVRWAPSRAELTVHSDPPSAWSLGQPGDQLVLGDWDCDGLVTPGLRRPSTGESFRFDEWPTERPVAAIADPLSEPSCP